MVSPYIKAISKLSGKPDKEIEVLWKKAKGITSDTFNKEEKDFDNREYNYTIGIVKQLLGIKEEVLDPSKFLDSDLKAESYLETLTSGSFPSLNKHIVNKSSNSEDEIENDDEDEQDELEDDDLEIEEEIVKEEVEVDEILKTLENYSNNIDWGAELDKMSEEKES